MNNREDAYRSIMTGNRYVDQGKYKKAIQSLERARWYGQRSKDIATLALALLGLARCHHRSENFHESCLFYKDALRLYRRLNDEQGVAIALMGLGTVELMLGKLSVARSHLESAKQYHQVSGNLSRLIAVETLLQSITKESHATQD